MKKPFEYKKPSAYTMSQTESGEQISYNVGLVRNAELTGSDPSVYVEVLADGLDDYLNSAEWYAAAMEASPCEIRPNGAAPTPQALAILEDRSVEFDPRKTYAGETVNKGAVVAGQMLFTEPCKNAVAISHRVTILDHTIQAGFTEAAIQAAGGHMLLDIERTAAGHVAKILSEAGNEAVREFEVDKLTGKPMDQAEDLIDILATHLDTAVGASISDYSIMVHTSLVAVLERAAQRAGRDDIEDLLGSLVQEYSGPNRGVFLLPKAFTSLSYRTGRDGKVWNIVTTRNPGAQAWDLEIMAVVDVVAQGLVKAKVGGKGLETVDAAYPLITQIKFKP
jgi:hypothetical protein